MKNMKAREEGGMLLDIQVIKCQQMFHDHEESSASSFPCLPSNTGFSQYDHARYLLGKIDVGCCNLDHMQSGLLNKLICVFILLLMYLCWI